MLERSIVKQLRAGGRLHYKGVRVRSSMFLGAVNVSSIQGVCLAVPRLAASGADLVQIQISRTGSFTKTRLHHYARGSALRCTQMNHDGSTRAACGGDLHSLHRAYYWTDEEQTQLLCAAQVSAGLYISLQNGIDPSLKPR